MITFAPADIFKLGLVMALACGAGLGIGYLLRRWLRPDAGFDWLGALLMWLGMWAFAMVASLVGDLTISAGQPPWLRSVLYALLALMAVGIGLAERRFAKVQQAALPSEPIHKVGG